MAEEVHTSQYSMQWVRHWGEVQKKLTYQHYGGNEDVVICFTSLKTWAKNLKLQVIIQNSHKGEKMFMCGEGKW